MKPARHSPRLSILAVDTGGTFTDFFLYTPDGIRRHKVLSTPRDPSQAIQKGLREISIPQTIPIVHGSTVATNALLEGKGARVALLTTAGFEDLEEIGRQNRSELYALQPRKTPPLAALGLRFGVRERLGAKGEVLVPLDRGQLKKIAARLRRKPWDSLAVCLLFSYANPRHERQIAKELRRLRKPISISSQICPEFREYERCSTTCVNAYVAPIMERYLQRLKDRVRHPIRIMQSNGGSLTLVEASREAVRTLLSGPAGGALGAWRIGKRAGNPRLLTLDMGGTSTDMSLIDGELELTSEALLGGHPVKTPMLRIDTIGAGGGSIAWIDAGGALRVGPQSAGAEPGPACYGRGGTQVTVTDAHVWLGRISPRHFLGGAMELFPKKILGPLAKLARRLKLSAEETASGIIEVANANMARSLRVLSLERGYDPRRFTLLPFGGAGGLHAAELAAALGIPKVLVPPEPGLLSAYGMAFADWRRDTVQTLLLPERSATPRRLRDEFAALKTQIRRAARREGIRANAIAFEAGLDIRYLGQSYELSVPMGTDIRRRFEAAHRRRYGYIHPGLAIEIVNLRLQGKVVSAISPINFTPAPNKTAATVEFEVSLFWRGRRLPCRVLSREALAPKRSTRGPLLIAEYSGSTFVPPGWRLARDRYGNLVLNAESRRGIRHG